MEYRYCTINDHELCLVFVNKRDQYIFMWRIPAPMLPRLSTTDQDTHTNSMRRSCHQHHKKRISDPLIPSFIVKRKHTAVLKKTHKKSVFKLFNISECYFRWLPISIVQPFLALCLFQGNASRYFSSVFARTL